MEIAAIALLLVASALLAAGVARQRRLQSDVSGNSGGGALVLRRSAVRSTAKIPPRKESHASPVVNALLVQLEPVAFPDEYLLVAQGGQLERLRRQGVILDAGRAVAGTNLVAQAMHGYQSSANLVRLSGGTVQAIKNGAEVIPGPDGFLGVLRSPATGKFAQQVQWTPVNRLAASAAGITNAVTMAMIQLQLEAISKQLTMLAKDVGRLSDSFTFTVDGQVSASVRAVGDVRDQALALGRVTDQHIASLSGSVVGLDAHIERLARECQSALGRLRDINSQDERLAWLRSDGIATIDHLRSLLQASRAWEVGRTLHAASYVSGPDGADRPDARLLLEQTQRRAADLDGLVSQLAYEYLRALDFALQSEGKVKFLGEQVKEKLIQARIEHQRAQVQELAGRLRNMLASLGIPVPQVPAMPDVPQFGDASHEDQRWEELLPLLLRPDESVQFLVHGSGVGGQHNLSEKPSLLVVTDQRVLGMRKSTFAQVGKLHLNVELQQVVEVAKAAAYFDEQIRLTLRDGRKVDLGIEGGPRDAAIRQLEVVLGGECVARPFGPAFGPAARPVAADGAWAGEALASASAGGARALEP